MVGLARRKRVGFVSLGCPKALTDTERIVTRLNTEGFDAAPSYDAADVVVVNTCGFIDSAVEESLDAIGEAVRECGRVVVTGCLGAKAEVVTRAHPDVLAVTGPHSPEAVAAAVRRALPPPLPRHGAPLPAHGVKLTPPHYAYLKIAEGCNHHCTFCIIPSLRGKLASRPVGEVLREAESLAAAGVKELLVVSQDTSAYGLDIRYRDDEWRGQSLPSNLVSLCEGLGQLFPWVRLHYIYPYPHIDRLLPLMADGALLPYFDVPLQHGAPTVLRRMGRPAAAERVLERIRGWREAVPNITLRSTFIVGFPGETDAEFEELLQFLREARLDRVGCFTYSNVDGAAANEMPGQVPEPLKRERFDALMALQGEISAELAQARVGEVAEVLVDSATPTGAVGRTQGDAPDVDGVVHIRGRAQTGEFAQVHIVAADRYDLVAETVANANLIARSSA